MKSSKIKLAKSLLPAMLIAFAGNCYSQSSTYSLVVNSLDEITEKIITQNISQNVDKVLEKHKALLPKLNIQVNIGKQHQTHSYTDANSSECNININYHDNTPALLSNLDDDINFIIWHEIGHCILGKKIILNEEINWHPEILVKDDIKTNIKHLSRISFINAKCPTDKQCTQPTYKLAPPMIVYHEMFADMYAIMWWFHLNRNPSELLTLSKTRINQFSGQDISSIYATNFSIQFAMDDLESMKREPSVILAEKNAQKGLIEYIKYLNNRYPQLFKHQRNEND